MVWFKRFVDPIVLPDGRELLTLRDAAKYITALPKAEHDAADWQVAMETLIAERDGPEMLARITVMKRIGPAQRDSDAIAATQKRKGFSDRSVIDPVTVALAHLPVSERTDSTALPTQRR